VTADQQSFDMEEFLGKLKVRYQSLLEGGNVDSTARDDLRARLNSLRLAEALNRKIEANRQQPDHPLQIGILGPTQAGKSTLSNALTGISNAGVSALAGFTVHAQGFGAIDPGHDASMQAILNIIFNDFQQTPVADLDPENYLQYSITLSEVEQTEGLPSSIVWDSPDFDSIESRGYRSAVLRVAALADVLVFALSKDKYADRSVWDMMQLLQPLGKPGVIVVNKLNEEDRETVLSALSNRVETTFTESKPAIVTIPYIRGLDDAASAIPEPIIDELRGLLTELPLQATRQMQTGGLDNLIKEHWDDWVQPLVREHRALESFQEMVRLETEQVVEHYRKEYLEHPKKYDTFNRAVAELLTLLEVPGLAKPLIATRQLVTWPVRQLLNISGMGGGSSDTSAINQLELNTLMHGCSNLLSQLQNSSLDRNSDLSDMENAQWWLTVNRQLRESQDSISLRFQERAEAYQQDFQSEIDLAAHALYKQLAQQPAMLNSLRAARVTTDAAAIVLAVKSGGLAASDLLIAPAMLSVTSMLAEGAIGKYMDTVKKQLQTKQLEQVRLLVEEELEFRLEQLPEKMNSDRFFSVTPEELATATAASMGVKT